MKKKIEKKNSFGVVVKNAIYDKKIIISLLCLLLFIILTILAFTNNTGKIDNIAESFVIGIRTESSIKTLKAITNLGGGYALVAISLLLLVFIKKKKIPIIIIINLVTVFLTSQLFKIIFRRSRPDGVFLTTANGFGFPSGHSMVSMAYYLVILYILFKVLKSNISRTFAAIFFVSLIVLIGFSRVYLGVHYISDVIGGFLLGIAFAMIFIKFISSKGYIE